MQVKEIRTLICDDSRESLDVIRQKAEAIYTKLNIHGVFDLYDTCEAVSADSLNHCDIALLDVDFEGTDQQWHRPGPEASTGQQAGSDPVYY